jgi:hypothetical protein
MMVVCIFGIKIAILLQPAQDNPFYPTSLNLRLLGMKMTDQVFNALDQWFIY